MLTHFEGIGWQVKLRKSRNNHYFTLVREIVLGFGLRKGMPINYYLVEIEKLKQKGILILFDEKGIPNIQKIKTKTTTFLIKKK